MRVSIFGFEDICVVADTIYNSNRGIHAKNRKIPEKPNMLKVSYRSHAGDLNLAAGILDNMFPAFRKSFKDPQGRRILPRPTTKRTIDPVAERPERVGLETSGCGSAHYE